MLCWMSNSADAQDQSLRAAVSAWIEATGLDPQDPDLRGTPERVSKLWRESFLSGYGQSAADILGDPVPADGDTEVVLLRELPCHGMCPHHLLPWMGVASIAYLPGTQLVGFGRLHDLLRCFTQRLDLQERVTNNIADALMEHLDARGAACSIRAQHLCLSIPDDKAHARVLSTSLRGEFRSRADLQLLMAQGS